MPHMNSHKLNGDTMTDISTIGPKELMCRAKATHILSIKPRMYPKGMYPAWQPCHWRRLERGR